MGVSLLDIIFLQAFHEVGLYALVFGTSILKFIAAVFIAYGAGFNLWEIVLTAGSGSILGVVLFTYFGGMIRSWFSVRFSKRKSMSFAKRRMIVRVWKQYGLVGVAILTPFLSPPLAVAVALSFKTPNKKIILYLSISLIIWAIGMGAFKEGIMALVK
ncbi:MAG: hypothetical protein AAGI38_17800 [Bacteroidota bacterium]